MMLKREVVCALFGSLGFANLCALNLWHDHYRLAQRSVDYYRNGPYGGTLLAGTVLLILGLAAVFVAVSLYAARVKQPVARKVLRLTLILGFLFPAYLLQYVVSSSDLYGGWLIAARIAVFVCYSGILLAGSLYLLGGHEKPLRALMTLNLILSPLFFLLLLSSGILVYRQGSVKPVFASSSVPSAETVSPRQRVRVLWLIFDEMDYSVTFSNRPRGLQLPELDLLRQEALCATNARPPSNVTLSSIPALLDGRVYGAVEIKAANRLRLWNRAGDAKDWDGSDTVFAAARELGARAGVVGWFHPYCRLFGDLLSACEFVPATNTALLVRENYADSIGTVNTAWYLLRTQLELLPGVPGSTAPSVLDLGRAQHLSQFRHISRRGMEYAANPGLDLVFIHYPIPHPYGVYDRFRAAFSTSPGSTYLDNLVLADQVVGQLRHALEEKGLWRNTAIVLSSDHSLRKWDPALLGWDPGGGTARDGRERVPFLVRLPHETRHGDYTQRLNTTVTKAMVMGILDGTISTLDDLNGWLQTEGARLSEAQ